MDRYLSRRLLSAVCVGVGVCAGSLTQWIHSKPKRNDPMNDPCKCHSQCSLHNVSAASHEVAVVKKFQQWLPQVAASTIVTSGQYPQTPSNTGPQSGMTRFAVPEMKALIAYDDYVLHYDRRTRNAHWVFEHLTRERVKASEEAKREHSSFYEEPNIHPFFRSMNEDFKGSGFDRGHLAAAGNHRWSQQAMNQTFSLGNISPQVGKGFNRDAWNTLEIFTRKLTKHYPDLYVVTGPLFLPRREDDGKLYVKYEVIGKNHVAVPTHFFKVIVMVAKTGELELMSFVMPNQALPEKIDLRNYLVPLNTIERAAGLLFFESIPKDRFKRINSKDHSV